MISEAAKVSNLLHQELEKLKPIILTKASDIAVLNRRNSIIKDDLHTLNLWHRSFVCFKSFFLENPTLAAALVTSADQQRKYRIQYHRTAFRDPYPTTLGWVLSRRKKRRQQE